MSLLLALVLLVATAGASAAAPSADGPVEEAIRRAVIGRMGPAFTVRIADLSARMSEIALQLEARPVPGVRLGQIARFALFDASGARPAPRVGDAVATVFVSGPAVETVRAVERGEVLKPDDLTTASGEITGVLLSPLPTMAEVTGAETLRDIAAGETLTAALVRVPPAVVSGQMVTVVARIGGVSVESRAIAAQRGVLGQIIRLVNPDSRRRLRGKVVGHGRVEVLDEP